MKLIVENCNDKNFIIYLINILKNYILSSFNNRKCYYLNRYLDLVVKDQSSFNKFINCKFIVNFAVKHLVFKRYGDKYEITIDRNIKFLDLSAKLYDLCKFINYGSISVQGYPIFSEAFNYVNDNIQFLYYKYSKGF